MNEHRPQPKVRSISDRKVYWLLAGLSLVLLVFCAFFDLQIAQASYRPESRFGNFLRNFGEQPGHALILFSAGVYLWYGRNLLIRIVMLIPFCLEILILIDKYRPPGSFVEGAFVALLVLLPVVVILLFRRFMTAAGIARNSALVVLAGVLHPLFLVQILKKLWGRIRFNDLAEGALDFTPWYLPQGITGSQSFPSGHTAMGVMMCFLILYLPRHLRGPAFFPLFAWAIAVAASRVILGAHYVSDVSFSLLAGLGLLFFFNRLSAPAEETLQVQDQVDDRSPE